jgi:DNA transformation protein and related proteins
MVRTWMTEKPMGDKGARRTNATTDTAAWLVLELAEIGDVSSRSMFGGYGIFASGVMFALVDSGGTSFLRADDTAAAELSRLGAERHGRMPYWSVPPAIADDRDELVRRARTALEVARSASR